MGLIMEKTVAGCSMGSGRPTLDIPTYVDLFMNGNLPIDKLVTGKYQLADINETFRAQEHGKAIKPIVVFSE
jgi:alcohol dehydrogenase